MVAALLAERARWGLWVPVGLALGIGGYFSLRFEPPLWLGVVSSGGLGLAVWAARRHAHLPLLLLTLLVPALGFTAAQGQTWWMQAPVLHQDWGQVEITGLVVDSEPLPEGARVLLAALIIDRVPAIDTPARVRLRLPGKAPPPAAGTWIRGRAFLRPPPEPAAPGAYDFQRWAFFAGIGGVGQIRSWEPLPVGGPAPSGLLTLALALERARQWIGLRVTTVLGPGEAPAMTIALLNGEQSGIPRPAMEAMRISGLAHLLSISGLHVGLVAGLVFFTVRALLALIPPLALRYPIKKWAAGVGLLAAAGYVLLVGTPVPTLRSLIMTAVVLLAVLTDREALTMRLVALSALLVLLYDPSSLLGPSFQMSFGAVVALVAAYEALTPRLRLWRQGAGWLRRGGIALLGMFLSSVVATIATAPYSIYHFQTFAVYGVCANLIAIPLTSLWVMPWNLVVYLALPLGLEAWPLWLMNLGVTAVLWVARLAANLSGASWYFPAMPIWGMVSVSLGGVWLCLWQDRWRLWGLGPVLLGCSSLMQVEQPDILVAASGAPIALRTAEGGLQVSSRARSHSFTLESWLRREGRGAEPMAQLAVWPRKGKISADGRVRCDGLGCIYHPRDGVSVALIRDSAALGEDCAQVSVVITPLPAGRCAAPLVIDGWRLRRDGAHTLTFTASGVRVESVHAWRGDRPWTPRPFVQASPTLHRAESPAHEHPQSKAARKPVLTDE